MKPSTPQTPPPKTKTTLDQIHELISQRNALLDEQADLEKTLKTVTDKITKLEQETIPDLMLETGLSEVTTREGLKVAVTPFMNVRIPKAQEDVAFAELRAMGAGDIIKTKVAASVASGSNISVAMGALKAQGLEPELLQSVHYQTLNAWAREQVEAGCTLPGSLWVYSGNTIKTKETNKTV